MTSDVAEVLDAYGAAWGEPDKDRRRALLETAWTEDGIYRDTGSEALGRAALVDHIGAVLNQYPGARIELTSAPALHHGHVHFSWCMVSGSGDPMVRGVDFGTFAPDGRLCLIVGFFDPPADIQAGVTRP